MIPLWTAEDIVNATSGDTTGNWQANSVSIDSRTLKPGALFIAIIGERVDGHDYVRHALDHGAAAVMVSREVEGVEKDKLLLVSDTFKALEQLGVHARRRSQAKIIGITGSVGKTTTKECLRLMCEHFGSTYASKGNLNNHYGTPLSLANMPQDMEFGIFEMGMNHAGEIAKLTQLVRPHIAIITNVESVHLEFFANEQAIADAKAEIFEGLEQDGTAILNADNQHTDYIRTRLKKRQDIDLLTFSQKSDANVQFLPSGHTTSEGKHIISVEGKSLELSLASHTQPIMAAVLASLTTALALKLDIHKVATTLASFKEVKGRGQVTEVILNDKHMWWIDDSYNASPASMRAAFETLAMVAAEKQATRSIAVLGDMLELGEQSAALHAGLADAILAHGINMVFTVGELMQHLHQALVDQAVVAHHAVDLDAMKVKLKDQLQAGDVVLFKGSHGSNIHQLVNELQTC